MKQNFRAKAPLFFRSLPMMSPIATPRATTITTATTTKDTATTTVVLVLISSGSRTTVATLVMISLLVGIKGDASSVGFMVTVHGGVLNCRMEHRLPAPACATTLHSHTPTLLQLRRIIPTIGLWTVERRIILPLTSNIWRCISLIQEEKRSRLWMARLFPSRILVTLTLKLPLIQLPYKMFYMSQI